MVNSRPKICLLILFLFLPCWAENLYADVSPKQGGSHQQNSSAPTLTKAEKAWLAQNHTVRVRVGPWPPFLFSKNKVKGIAIDYVELIFKQFGIHYGYLTQKDYTFKEALQSIKERSGVDMLPTARITPEREKFMVFTQNYIRMPWVIFTRKDAPFVSSIKDLNGKTVAVQESFTMHQLLKKNYPGIRLHPFSGTDITQRCLSALATGVVDAFIGNLGVGTYLIQENGFFNIKVAAPTPFGSHDNAIGIRKDWPELAGIIDKGLNAITPEEHAAIINKYLSVRYEYGLRPWDIIKWVLAVVLLASMGYLFFLFWNRRLKAEISERRQIEEKLRISETQHRALSDATFEGIAISRNGTLMEVNNAFAKMLGYDRGALIGKNIMALVSPEERDNVENRISQGSESPYESICLRKDGSVFPVEIQGKVYSYQGQKVRVAAIRDITQRKETEAEIKVLRDILPICSYCKKIRDDDGYWNQIEEYISTHSETKFSHGICKECAEKHFPDLHLFDDDEAR